MAKAVKPTMLRASAGEWAEEFVDSQVVAARLLGQRLHKASFLSRVSYS